MDLIGSDSASFHLSNQVVVEAKTAAWLETLVAGGAEIVITGSPGSTQDDTAAALYENANIQVFARSDESFEDHVDYCNCVLKAKPDLIADYGADLHNLVYTQDVFRPLTKSAPRGLYCGGGPSNPFLKIKWRDWPCPSL